MCRDLSAFGVTYYSRKENRTRAEKEFPDVIPM